MGRRAQREVPAGTWRVTRSASPLSFFLSALLPPSAAGSPAGAFAAPFSTDTQRSRIAWLRPESARAPSCLCARPPAPAHALRPTECPGAEGGAGLAEAPPLRPGAPGARPSWCPRPVSLPGRAPRASPCRALPGPPPTAPAGCGARPAHPRERSRGGAPCRHAAASAGGPPLFWSTAHGREGHLRGDHLGHQEALHAAHHRQVLSADALRKGIGLHGPCRLRDGQQQPGLDVGDAGHGWQAATGAKALRPECCDTAAQRRLCLSSQVPVRLMYSADHPLCVCQ